MESQEKGNLFPKLIKEIRSRKGLTQAELAQLFEPPIAYQSVGQWERGENTPARRYWSKLAELADMDLGRFYEYVETGLTSTSSYVEEILYKIKYLSREHLELVTQATVEKWVELDEGQPKENKQHLALLKKGREVWNTWRQKNHDITPELYGADLSGVNFWGPSGELGVDLSQADLRGAKLCGTNLSRANLWGANLSGADLTNADFSYADLREANLSEANLTFADLRWALLVETNLEGATLVNCSVYGASIWEPKLDGAQELNLNTSSQGDVVTTEKAIYVDSLKLAPILHSIRNEPHLYETLKHLFQEEEEALKYASELVNSYGELAPNGSRIYFDLKERWCQVYQTENVLEVKVFDAREHSLILHRIDDKVHSRLLPGDLDHLKALTEEEKKNAALQERKKQKPTQRVHSPSESVLSD
jgi:transcriptional regulator with XRE-family HTH domain